MLSQEVRTALEQLSNSDLQSAFRILNLKVTSSRDSTRYSDTNVKAGSGTITVPGTENMQLFQAMGDEMYRRRLTLPEGTRTGTAADLVGSAASSVSTSGGSSEGSSGGSFGVLLLVGAAVLGFLFFGKKS